MKPGTRVRISSGEHEGRLGEIVDHVSLTASILKFLKDSPTRAKLLERLNVPAGCHAVRLDHADGERCHGSKILPVGHLIPTDDPPHHSGLPDLSHEVP